MFSQFVTELSKFLEADGSSVLSALQTKLTNKNHQLRDALEKVSLTKSFAAEQAAMIKYLDEQIVGASYRIARLEIQGDHLMEESEARDLQKGLEACRKKNLVQRSWSMFS